MGCGASAPAVNGDGEHPQKGHRPEGGAEGEAEAPVNSVELGRGGGKSVERHVAESSRRALKQVLSGRFRDYVIDGSGRKVRIDALKGAPVGILFTAQSIPEGRQFQRLLLDVHQQLRQMGRPFEVVLVSNDETEELWRSAVAETPWVTLPFNDTATVDSIGTRFEVGELPTLILLDREGKLVTNKGIDVIRRLGAAAWPFSEGSIKAADATDAEAIHDKAAAAAAPKGARESQVAPEATHA